MNFEEDSFLPEEFLTFPPSHYSVLIFPSISLWQDRDRTWDFASCNIFHEEGNEEVTSFKLFEALINS